MAYTEVAYYIETLHRCRPWPSNKPLTHSSSRYRYSVKSVELIKLLFYIVQKHEQAKGERNDTIFSNSPPAMYDNSCLAIHLANTLLQFNMHRILERMIKPYDQLAKVSCSGISHITCIARIRHHSKKRSSFYISFFFLTGIYQKIEKSLKTRSRPPINCTVCTACI